MGIILTCPREIGISLNAVNSNLFLADVNITGDSNQLNARIAPEQETLLQSQVELPPKN